MSDNLSLQALIDQVKQDLMPDPSSMNNPLFFVEKVEVEVAVNISEGAKGGVNIHIFEVGGNVSREQADKITVTLSPILSRTEQIELLKQNPVLYTQIKEDSEKALRKSGAGRFGNPE